MNLIQIGSGAANFDENFQDGFTNFVKKKIKKGNIFVVEANSIHIKKLKKNWRKTKNVKIFNLAIIPDNVVKNKMVFFYSEDDKPDFQIFSNSNFFVKRHFPNSKIKKKVVRCISISNFFKKNFIKKIDFLSLDIEGMDFDVLYNLDLKKFTIKNISFEHLHLSFWQKIKIIKKFVKNKYFFSGMGFDIRKSDWMFTKNYTKRKITTYLLPFTPRRIWKNYLFSEFF